MYVCFGNIYISITLHLYLALPIKTRSASPVEVPKGMATYL